MKSNPTPLIIIFVIAAAIFMVETDGGPIFEPLPSTEISSNSGTQNQNVNNSNTPIGTTPPNTKVKQESEYERWVNIQNKTRSRYDGAAGEESITISVSHSAPKPIDISEWQIWSVATGNRATIGKGLLYPQENGGGLLSPIILNPGEEAIVYTGLSPLKYSFKQNICFGYMEKQFNSYRINNQCPYLEDAALPLPFFDRRDECKEFIERLPQCEVPNKDADYPDGISEQCQNHIESLVGYDNCMNYWRNNENFLYEDWFVYLNRTGKMYRDRNEKILLFDERGILVDEL